MTTAEKRWDELPDQLITMRNRWLAVLRTDGMPLEETERHHGTAALSAWIGLILLINAMREHAVLLSLYPSVENALLRLSLQPLQKDSDITYDLTPTFPLWCKALPDGRYRVMRYVYNVIHRGRQHETVTEGDADRIASLIAQEVALSGYGCGRNLSRSC